MAHSVHLITYTVVLPSITLVYVNSIIMVVSAYTFVKNNSKNCNNFITTIALFTACCSCIKHCTKFG